MQWIIVDLIVVLASLTGSTDSYEIPTPQVIFYQNNGFEVSIAANSLVSLLSFHGRKNVALEGREAGSWNADIIKPTYGRMVFVEPNTKFNLGDRLHYWIYVIHDGVGHELLYQEEEVKRFGVPSPGVTVQKNKYIFSQPRIRFLNPRGFEVSIPAEDGLTLMAFHAKINEPFAGLEGGTISKDILVPNNDYFTYKDQATRLKAGDKLYFWIHVIFKGLGYNLLDQYYEYRGDEIQNHNSVPSRTDGVLDIRPTQPVAPHSEFEPTICPSLSISIVNGKRNVCAGAEIFSDTFGSLNEERWLVEKKIAGAPDFEYVIYSNESITTGRNGLRIEPKLFAELYGRGREQLRRDLIVDQCTGVAGSFECKYFGKTSNDIAPPVVSAQISTRNKFSFLFGRVEIEARLPRGDWIVPQLWLQPNGAKYDKSEYKAGQIRIGFVENNPERPYDNRVGQGVILSAKEPLRSAYLSGRKLNQFRSNWENEFHTFSVEWKPDGIHFWIDNDRNNIANWKTAADSIPGSKVWKDNNIPVAPFDQEFYLTLGLGVGGINDFSNITTLDVSSPNQKRIFERNKATWLPKWAGTAKSLDVRSVKIFAL